MKHKILFVITKSNFGGAQRYVYDLATTLKYDYDVSVAFGGQGVLAEKLTEAGIRTFPIPSLIRDINIFSDLRAFIDLVKLLRTERPDIVHLNSSKAGAMGGLAARLAGIPKIVFTGHGWAFNEERSVLSKQIIVFMHWITVITSHITIAVAEKIKLDIEQMPFTKNRIKVIYNGIGFIDFLTRESARSELSLPSGFLIGTISELHKNKGLDFAIKAFEIFHKNHPESHFVILGDGEERERLSALIKKLDLESSVHLLGFIKDASNYLKAFDVVTLTSRTEAFPYAILEAGAAGSAIVASAVGGIPEVIQNEVSGILVPPGDVNSIAAALELMSDENRRRTFGEAIQKKVAESFSLVRMVEETTAVYLPPPPKPIERVEV